MRPRVEAALALGLSLAIFLPGLGAPTLLDPWETHYAEVGRRILEDDDWIRLQWQQEGFRSKPALAPWLIAASLRVHGLAEHGGQAPELVHAEHTAWAVRLPFALFAAMGCFVLWLVVRRFASRSIAWLTLLVLGTTPLYLLLGRQAITDMPMVATTTAAIALLYQNLEVAKLRVPLTTPQALGVAKLRVPLTTGVVKGTRSFATLVVQGLIVGWGALQLVYGLVHLGRHPCAGAGPYDPRLLVLGPTLGVLLLLGLLWWRWPGREPRHASLFGAYALLGVGVLAKGPPGLALTALVGLAYIASTKQWKKLLSLRLFDGLLIVLVVAGPWHLAMAVEDGPAWVNEYIGHHWLARAAGGAHSANAPGTDTLRYYVEQLGYSALPWVPLLGAAVASAARAPKTERLRWLALLWLGLGVLFFTCVRTRFHHYVAPALGGLALLVAWLLDDLARGRLPQRERVLLVLGALALVPIARDLAHDPAVFVELVTYRYDRPWPDDVDLRWPAAALAALAAAGAVVASLRARFAFLPLTAAVGLWLFLSSPYLEAAGTHWGQGHLVRTYYDARGPHDPLLAWQLYWRGEVFWSQGEVRELRHGTAADLADAASPEAERVWVLTEAGRQEALRAAVPAPLRDGFRIEDARSNKFVLASFPTTPRLASPSARR